MSAADSSILANDIFRLSYFAASSIIEDKPYIGGSLLVSLPKNTLMAYMRQTITRRRK